MLDIKFIRENPDIVKENIKKKFQDQKLPLVDEVIALDAENRAAIAEAQELRTQRNKLSKEVGKLMGQAKKDPSKLEEAEAVKAQVKAQADRLAELEDWTGLAWNGPERLLAAAAEHRHPARSFCRISPSGKSTSISRMSPNMTGRARRTPSWPRLTGTIRSWITAAGTDRSCVWWT
jgi:hypothetical protein